MIVLDRPDLTIQIELKPDPPEPAQYIWVYVDDHEDANTICCILTAAEAITLADALKLAAARGRLVE